MWGMCVWYVFKYIYDDYRHFQMAERVNKEIAFFYTHDVLQWYVFLKS